MQPVGFKVSSVVEAAPRREPQRITRLGRDAVIELRIGKPSRKVVQWISAQRSDSLFITVVIIGEIELGIEKARDSDAVFAADWEQCLETLPNLYADRVLQVPASTARLWSRLSAKVGQDRADLTIPGCPDLSQVAKAQVRERGHFARGLPVESINS